MKNSNKAKLTLAIDKDVIEKAKTNGINISAVTERLLVALTSNDSDAYKTQILKAIESYDIAVRNLRKAIIKK